MAAGLGALLSGCSGVAPKAPAKPGATAKPSVVPPYKGGGYYKDDGPGAHPPAALHAVPDAVPSDEPLHRFANKPYKVFSKTYVPDTRTEPYQTKGLASWYGRKFHGKATASGETYDMYAMTAAHRTLPIPSYARVTNPGNGNSVVVRINDRGPFHEDRLIDLSYTAAYKLDLLKGVGEVEILRLFPGDEADTDSFAAVAEETAPPTAFQATPRPEVAIETRPLAEATANPAALAAPSARYYLQVGAYSSPGAADAMLARLARELGQQVPGVTRQTANGLVKVQAGPYENAAQADAAAAHIAAALGIRPFRVAAAAEPSAQPAPSAPGPARPSPAHWLQLAAYANAQTADGLYNRMQARGDLPGVEKLRAAGLTKVQAGPYASLNQAEQAALALAEDLGHKPYRLMR